MDFIKSPFGPMGEGSIGLPTTDREILGINRGAGLLPVWARRKQLRNSQLALMRNCQFGRTILRVGLYCARFFLRCPEHRPVLRYFSPLKAVSGQRLKARRI